MKKNYTSPVVEVNAFDFEDVVMTSGVGGTYSLKAGTTDYDTNLEKLKQAASTTVIVQW